MNDKEHKKLMIIYGAMIVLNAINFILCVIQVVMRMR